MEKLFEKYGVKPKYSITKCFTALDNLEEKQTKKLTTCSPSDCCYYYKCEEPYYLEITPAKMLELEEVIYKVKTDKPVDIKKTKNLKDVIEYEWAYPNGRTTWSEWSSTEYSTGLTRIQKPFSISTTIWVDCSYKNEGSSPVYQGGSFCGRGYSQAEALSNLLIKLYDHFSDEERAKIKTILEK